MQYPMKKKTDRPLFDYMVRGNSSFDYYLFTDFDSAIKKAAELSRHDIGLVFEVYFNTATREFFGHNTFNVYDGKICYDKHKPIGLHLQFYLNAGEWLNPDEKMVEKSNKSRKEISK